MALRARFAISLTCSLLLLACGDPPAETDGGGADGGPSNPCEGAADGTSCGAGMVCMGGECVSSSGACGDGVVDDGEQCDDGNEVAFDGCEPSTCTFTCSDDAACDDGVTCNGPETCGETSHVCERGAAPDPGTACSTADITDGVCGDAGDGSVCLPAGCGNGVLEDGETCDDGNDVGGDGCEMDCTYSCEADADCDDGNVCTGVETCDTATHACSSTDPLDCTPPTPCEEGTCDPVDGCLFTLIDGDMDGQASETLGACGTDCDDTDDTIFEGAEELCDGEDNNCNGVSDETAPNWYIDCDGDGWAADTTGSRESCMEPMVPTGCGGGWTSRRPFSVDTIDCDDADPDRSPGATELCNGADEDCDESVDEGVMTTYYLDGDDDGYGMTTDFMTACDPSGDYDATMPDDCDDGDATRNPGATEMCNNVDENCDGVRDEGMACGPTCMARTILGRTYLFCRDEMPFPASATWCSDRGYRLVSLTSPTEDAMVHAAASAIFVSRDEWWIGLYDRVTEGSYEWIDFGPAVYTNWDAGEPAPEDCAVQARDTGAWRMIGCAMPRNRVCEPQ